MAEDALQVRRTAHEGTILEGTKTDHGEEEAGRVVPVPATLARMLEAQIKPQPPRLRAALPNPRGRLCERAPSIATSGSRRRERQAWTFGPTSAATLTSRTCGAPMSTTPT
jgi:hypothetical protein